MKRTLARIIAATFMVVLLLSAAAPAYAADATFFGPLVPNGTNGQPDCSCPNSAPDWGCVMQTVQNSINLAISLSLILATLYIIYTGFMFVVSAGNPKQVEAAKTRLMNVVVGVALLLSAWLIVDFIMKKLYGGDQGVFGPWNAMLRSEGDDLCIDKAAISPLELNLNAEPGSQGGGVVGAGRLTHAAAQTMLEAAGISIASSGNCSTRSNGSCTSLENMREDTVKQAIAVKQACNCTVVVTGGTEVGHESGPTSHYNGFKIDLRTTDGVNQYIQSNLSPAGQRGGDAIYVDKCGNEYVREGSPAHWDITVTRGVCSPPK